MGVSKHRKAHKQKSAARTKQIQQKRQHAMSLVKQLEEQLQIVQNNPITGVDIQPSEEVRLTGSLPSYEIKL